MLPADALSRDDEQLLPLVVAMADGALVDWSSAPPPLVDQLQHLERIIRGLEALRSLPPRHAVGAHETLLTEARRTAGLAEHSLQVRWGPLIVHEKIGRGSFGDVYRAWDPRLDREVALKLIPERTSETDASPVVEEGRLLARVRHPNVMVVYGAERIDRRVGIWTEYIRGETLVSEVARRGPLPAEEAAGIGSDVCAALGAVHRAGLLHRDVKAQNILRDSTGRIVLGDFGTGVEFVADDGVPDPQIAGTPLYLAPEVIAGQSATIASDLYGVGVLLYFLVTGAYPVRGHTLAEIKGAHAAQERVPLRKVRTDLPDGLVLVIEKLLATDPGERYATASAAELALASSLAEPGSVRPFRRRAVLAAVAAATVLAATVTAVWQSKARGAFANAPVHGSAFGLKAGDWILVNEFDNRTGEAVLDGTIRAAIERELDYSDYVRVVQRDRVEDALKVLRKPANSQLDRDLALAVSQRDGGIRAVITGTTTKDASGYNVTAEILNPASGASVTTLAEHAPRPSDVLTAVRHLTLRIRENLREPVASIERSRETLDRAVVPSLKAVNIVEQSKGASATRRARSLADWRRIETMARAVIEEDPSYPLGHLMLAWAMTLQGRRDEGIANNERALRLADAATPQERLFMIATGHQFKGWGPDGPPSVADRAELEKAAASLEALFTLQPDQNYVVRNLLRDIYLALDRERDLAWMNIRLADARPWNARVNYDVANHQLREGNIDAARRYGTRAELALLAGASEAEPDLAASVRLFPAYVAWIQDDATEMLRLLDRVSASVEALAGDERRQVLRRLWRMYAAAGRLRQAEQAIEAAHASDPGGFVYTLNTELTRAELLVERGDLGGLRAFAAARWKDALPDGAPPFAARRVTFLIDAGLLDAAERDLEWFKRRTAQPSGFAPGTPTAQFQPFYEASAGALEFARGRPEDAVARLERALPAIRKAPPQVLSAGGSHGQYAAVQLASANEAMGNVSAAIAILEEAVEDRVGVTIGNTPNRWLRTSAQLARLYRKNGQANKARAVEAHLSKLLVTADTDHPLVIDLRGPR